MNANVRVTAAQRASVPKDRPVRLLLAGVWDLFHHGHAQAMKTAKELFPKTTLVVGVHADQTVMQFKGKFVLDYAERKSILNHIKWVDEILDNVPWYPTLEWLDQHRIDFVVGDEHAYEQYEAIPFLPVREAGRFISVPREEGISTASILARVVRNYDSYLNQILDKGKTMKEMNVSYLKGMELAAKRQLSSFMSAMNPAANDRNLRVGGFVQSFGERMLHSWNILGTVKELVIRRNQRYAYPAKEADQPSVEVENMHEVLAIALEFSRKSVPGWQTIQEKDVKITVVTGGLTNRLYKVAISPDLAVSLTRRNILSPDADGVRPDNSGSGSPPTLDNPLAAASTSDSGATFIPHQLLLRVYGAGTENFFNRENEHKIFRAFSDSGMGPKLYCIFDGGRIEEFLSLHSLEQHDLPKLAPLIAEKIAMMHASNMPGLPTTPSLFDSLWTWLRTAEDIAFPNDPEKQRMLDDLHVEKLPGELQELQAALLALNSPVYFCHNDLLGGNIMYDEETQRLCFIDYEYGSYNFRGFDIGNHFCERSVKYGLPEWPHFKLDPKKYPNKTQQRLFFTSYLTQYHLSTGQPPEVSEEEISRLSREVNAFALASHFLWSIWAIIQASTSDIEFGYLEFSKCRLDSYYSKKQAFLYGKTDGLASSSASLSLSSSQGVDSDEPRSDEDESSFSENPTHRFEESHFNSPTWCGHCKRFVYQPFGKQGYRCMACNMKVHRGCVNKVTSRCLSPHPSAMWPIVEL